MYIVGFNGPPRSGKDTMSSMLVEHMESQGVTVPVIEVSLSTPLRKIAYAMTGCVSISLDGPNYEAFKMTHWEAFGKDGRQIMIDISEKFLKPVYGQGIMGHLLMGRLKNFTGVVLIRDTGFAIEKDVLSNYVGNDNLYVARVVRSGCDFTNDSREWVEHCHSAIYRNNGTLDDLRTEAGRLYGRLVNQMGWVL
jgi:hypothetical protein